MRGHFFIPNPCGEFRNPKTGKIWIPDEEPKTFRKNPFEYSDWGPPSSARLFVGLRVGRGEFEGEEIDPEEVRDATMEVRLEQVGEEYGASFISQKGHWYDKKKKEVVPEDSLQIFLYPGDEGWEKFKKNVKALAEELADRFGQESIIMEFQHEGRVVEQGAVEWKD